MSITQRVTDGIISIDTGNGDGLLDQAPTTTTLAAAITTPTQAALTLTSGTHVKVGAYIQIGSEIIYIQSGSGGSYVGQRGMLGTTASTYSIGATVNLPGYVTLTLLTIANAPNVSLFVQKLTTDINFVDVTVAGGNTFPGGATHLYLIDTAANGSVHIKFPVGSTMLIAQGLGTGSQGPPGPAGSSAAAPTDYTIGTVTGSWVVISA